MLSLIPKTTSHKLASAHRKNVQADDDQVSLLYAFVVHRFNLLLFTVFIS
jgi:hypothetical protein